MMPTYMTLRRGRLPGLFTGAESRLLAYLLFLVATLAVWMPGGFNVGPVSDGWINLTSGTWISGGVGTRILQNAPRMLGLSLTPGDFVGWQSLLLALTLVRAILVYEIALRLLDGQRAYALACGLFALFHPMDHLYFWVDAINVDMAYALALAASLAALIHLENGSRISLAALWALQLLSCFTYTGFIPVLGAFPVLIWMLWKLDGRPVASTFPLKGTLLVVLFVILMMVEAELGKGRESRVASFELAGIIKGYFYQIHTLGLGWLAWSSVLKTSYLLPAAVAGIIAFAVAWRTTVTGRDDFHSPVFYATLGLMLVALAGASYLPYALSQLRIGHTRQMLAAGLFLLMALLLPVFLWLSYTLPRRRLAAVLIALFAGSIVITGLEMRRAYLEGYQAQESLLAALATVVPDPPAGSIIIVEPDIKAGRGLRRTGLAGLSNRYLAFTEALRYMYGDSSLVGSFRKRHDGTVLRGFTRDGVAAGGYSIPYGHLIFLRQEDHGTLQVSDLETLRGQVPTGTDISGYRPGPYRDAPGQHSRICRMLQAAYRPAYCH